MQIWLQYSQRVMQSGVGEDAYVAEWHRVGRVDWVCCMGPRAWARAADASADSQSAYCVAPTGAGATRHNARRE